MFQTGDFVVYGCMGIHKVLGTTTLDIEGVSKEKLYYMMQPFGKPEGTVYAPVDSKTVNLRPIMTKDETTNFLKDLDGIKILDIKNDKQREDAYKSCIRSCDPYELARVIKTLYHRQAERNKNGKKLTLTDHHYLSQAEAILYEELSIVLDVPMDEVPQHMDSHLKSPIV